MQKGGRKGSEAGRRSRMTRRALIRRDASPCDRDARHDAARRFLGEVDWLLG